MTYKNDSGHYPIICHSSKGRAEHQNLMVFITEYNVRFFVRVLQIYLFYVKKLIFISPTFRSQSDLEKIASNERPYLQRYC